MPASGMYFASYEWLQCAMVPEGGRYVYNNFTP